MGVGMPMMVGAKAMQGPAMGIGGTNMMNQKDINRKNSRIN